MERGWCLPSVPLPRSGKRLRRKRIDGDRSEHRQSPSKDSERKAGNAPLRSLKTELNKNRWLLCAKNKRQTVDGWITQSCLRLSAFSTLRGCHIFSNATAPFFVMDYDNISNDEYILLGLNGRLWNIRLI